MREEYVEWLVDGLDEQGFAYLRVGNDVFVRLIYPLHWFVEAPSYGFLEDFLANFEWRYVREVISARSGDGSGEGRSTILDRLADRLAPTSTTDLAPYSDCEVMRAAMIRVEDLTPDQRRRVIPKTPLPSGCYARHVRDTEDFDPRCGDLTDSVVGGRYLP